VCSAGLAPAFARPEGNPVAPSANAPTVIPLALSAPKGTQSRLSPAASGRKGCRGNGGEGSASLFCSAGILPASFAFLRLMGRGLSRRNLSRPVGRVASSFPFVAATLRRRLWSAAARRRFFPRLFFGLAALPNPATAASPKCSQTPSPASNASQEAKQRPKNPPTKNSGSGGSKMGRISPRVNKYVVWMLGGLRRAEKRSTAAYNQHCSATFFRASVV